MTEKEAMAFHLTVTAGPEEGKSFRVEPGECVIGRAPTSTIVLSDETVAWEHALLRTDGGRIILQNLAAAGTRVKGRVVSGEVRLASNEEIELSERCKVVIQQQVGREAASSRLRPRLILAVVGVLAILTGGAYFGLRPEETPPPRFTHGHYENAYRSLEARLERWAAEGQPGYEETKIIFKNAWRLERAFNPEAAAIEWDHLRSLLLTIKRPDEERTIAQTKDTDAKKALGVIAEWDPVTTTSTEPYYDGNEAYADALARFVRRRSEITHIQVEERQ